MAFGFPDNEYKDLEKDSSNEKTEKAVIARDQLWCRALISTLSIDDIAAVTKKVIKLRDN